MSDQNKKNTPLEMIHVVEGDPVVPSGDNVVPYAEIIEELEDLSGAEGAPAFGREPVGAGFPYRIPRFYEAQHSDYTTQTAKIPYAEILAELEDEKQDTRIALEDKSAPYSEISGPISQPGSQLVSRLSPPIPIPIVPILVFIGLLYGLLW